MISFLCKKELFILEDSMKKLTGDQIRQMFLDYFKSKGHMVEPGASLVPINDPTLLWINAGVAALKKYFDGREKPLCNRITNAQKSIRTNDIENVGRTARHHTFFEMLGNFSIGDYFKEEAIPFAWEFLTSPQWIGFDKDRMYVTIHPDDQEAYRIWVDVCKIDPRRILKTYNNYWEIGEGPSGPNSEIFYDRGEKYDPQGIGERLFFEDLENDRYIEVWNVVFSQYDAKEGVDRKDYKELPQKNIDTGMGLERLVCLVQDGETNFDTDLFLPIIHATEKMAKHPYEGEYKMAYRVIADHIRTVTFALSDGATFSNEGRGYVLRRVLRRAIRFGIKLGIQESFMYRLVSVVAENMKEFYPYLLDKVHFVSTLVQKEEQAFHETLVNGEKLLQEAMKNTKDKCLSGEVVFKLYDTYGFPKELTVEIASDAGLSVDLKSFEACMQKQKELSRSSRDVMESMTSQSIDLLNFREESKFLGYDQTSCTGKIIGLFKNGVAVDVLNDEGDIIFDQTCFYAESGGQIADTGRIFASGVELSVTDVKKAVNKQHLHHVKVVNGSVKVNDVLQLQIDEQRRYKIMLNHSSVHLLHAALRKIVGTHITQAGSYVSDEYARFDFTNFEKISDETLREIEDLVNAYIAQAIDVKTEVMSLQEAKNTGAIALFDEKYGDLVRVVFMADTSIEFCGGTHVKNTSQLGVFKIEFEESIGSGIRRIQTKTSMNAYHDFANYKQQLEYLSGLFKLTNINALNEKVEHLLDENTKIKKELQLLKEKQSILQANEYIQNAKEIHGVKVLLLTLDAYQGNLKGFAEILRNKLVKSFVFVISVEDEKLTYVACSSKEAIEKNMKANEVIKFVNELVSGKGGGKPDVAQGGCTDPSKADVLIKEVETKLQSL